MMRVSIILTCKAYIAVVRNKFTYVSFHKSVCQKIIKIQCGLTKLLHSCRYGSPHKLA